MVQRFHQLVQGYLRDQFNVLNLPNVLFRKESVLLKPDVVWRWHSKCIRTRIMLHTMRYNPTDVLVLRKCRPKFNFAIHSTKKLSQKIVKMIVTSFQRWIHKFLSVKPLRNASSVTKCVNVTRRTFLSEIPEKPPRTQQTTLMNYLRSDPRRIEINAIICLLFSD